MGLVGVQVVGLQWLNEPIVFVVGQGVHRVPSNKPEKPIEHQQHQLLILVSHGAFEPSFCPWLL